MISRRFIIGNTHAELVGGIRDALGFLHTAAAPERTIYGVELVIEETLTNILKYAFDDEDRHEIQLTVWVGAGEVRMEFVDDGKEFDPLQRADPPLPDSIAHAHPGGLGIYLVKQTAQLTHYRREDDRNVFTAVIGVSG